MRCPDAVARVRPAGSIAMHRSSTNSAPARPANAATSINPSSRPYSPARVPGIMPEYRVWRCGESMIVRASGDPRRIQFASTPRCACPPPTSTMVGEAFGMMQAMSRSGSDVNQGPREPSASPATEPRRMRQANRCQSGNHRIGSAFSPRPTPAAPTACVVHCTADHDGPHCNPFRPYREVSLCSRNSILRSRFW